MNKSQLLINICLLAVFSKSVDAQVLWSSLNPQPTSDTTVIINNNDVYELDVDGNADILRIANQSTGESGTLNIAQDRTLTVARFVQLGTQAGPGYLNQSNGTVTAQQFSINHNSTGALSEYNLSGGSATATTSVTVNNQGLLDITGGSMTTPALTVNSGGSANLTGGTLNMNGTLTANGTVTINGGTIARTITGVNTSIAGTGKIELLSGSYALTGGGATDQINLGAALIEVSGGTLNWTGQVRGGNAGGVFRVIGDDATINMGRWNSQTGQGTEHTLEFVLGETGISTIVVDGFVHLSGATINIDGSAYTGAAGTFNLISTPNIASLSSSITLTGFDAFQDAFVTQSTTDNIFTLTIVPEPRFYGLALGLLAFAGIVLRRLRARA